jgi:hypothetical protein
MTRHSMHAHSFTAVAVAWLLFGETQADRDCRSLNALSRGLSTIRSKYFFSSLVMPTAHHPTCIKHGAHG